MDNEKTLQLELGDQRIPFLVGRTATARSPHTERDLSELHGWVTTADPQVHEWLTKALQTLDTRAVRAWDEQDEFAGRWSISWNSYAESDDEHLYTLILSEDEELSLSALVLEGIELHPYEYREEFSGDELTIWAKLVGSKAGVLRLRALLKTRDSFSVVRRGINDTPRQMRFGVAEWSEHEGRIKYRVVLVDAGAELAEHPEVVRIEEANTRAALSYYMGLVDRLTDLLVKRGVLPAEEIELIRESARSELWHSRRDFWRVPDVDLL
ncbi:hypothetical protein BH23GEM3_BH23GEM3_11920 [soil metagenome]